jgi:hypothetical protein
MRRKCRYVTSRNLLASLLTALCTYDTRYTVLYYSIVGTNAELAFAGRYLHSYLSISHSSIQFCSLLFCRLFVVVVSSFLFLCNSSTVGRLEQEETHNATTLSNVDFLAGLFPGRDRARHCQQLHI